METILLGIFIAGYLLITLEHSLRIDKLIPALGMMAFLWAIIAIFNIPVFEVDTELRELIPTKVKKIMAYHLSHTSEILIFLLGAMTIVEIIDYYNGFEKIVRFHSRFPRSVLIQGIKVLHIPDVRTNRPGGGG